MRTKLDDDELIVDMAPLIDCVFLLLIFFLVATTLKKIDKELPLTLPDSSISMDVQQPNEYSVIGIDRDGNFYLDSTPVTISILQSDLRKKAQEDKEFKLRLDVDKDVAFSRVMQVLDILRFEGLTNTGINTRRDENTNTP